jgi:hypothetical protein
MLDPRDSDAEYTAASTIVVFESAGAVHFVYGFLTVAFAAALIRGHLGAETDLGRTVVDIVFGVLAVGTLAVWIYMRRHPGRIGVSRDQIQQWARGKRRAAVITKEDGDLYIRYSGSYKSPQPFLRATGTDQALFLTMYTQQEVIDACIACGWRFVKP